MQVLDDQQQESLVAKPPEQAEQQLKESSLGVVGLTGRAWVCRVAKGGKQPGHLRP